MSKTVVGLMNSETQAQGAMRELLDKGFESDAIGLMSSSQQQRHRGRHQRR